MPVHDKHMQECDAEPAAKRQALAAVVTARNEPRSAYLEWRDRKLQESTNWLDYLQAVNEDAYHVLLRHSVNVQITDPPELRCTLEPDASSPVSFNWRFPHNLRYSLEYYTLEFPKLKCVGTGPRPGSGASTHARTRRRSPA